MVTQADLEKARQFYEDAGLLDTAAEIAKRMGNFDRANELYDRVYRDYMVFGRLDVALELEERKRNPISSYKILDDFL